jgi:hypothetical protein
MTDERHDDEVLGRALSRAIETQAPHETPYERSRIAGRPTGSAFGFWQFAGVAATLVVALAFGAWFTRPTDRGPVAASTTPTASAPSAVTSGPTQTSPVPTIPGQQPYRVFFVRDLLPPVSASALGQGRFVARPEDRIQARLGAALGAQRSDIPSDAANPLALVGSPAGNFSMSISVSGDTAKVEFTVSDWGVRGAAQVQALVQQLVYVITEEPGIRKAQIVEKGKNSATIDGLVVDKPLSREDVTDYSALGTSKTAQGFGDASAAASRKLTTRVSVDTVATALARFVVETDLQSISPTVLYPDFKVEVFQNDEAAKPLGGKWRMVVTVNGTDAATGTVTVDKAPVRSIVTSRQGNNTVYEIGLDDLRPWRTAIAYNPFRIIVDIGGDPRTIFGDTQAVYAPSYGATVGRTFQVSGIAHNFEANVVIRVRDDKDREILITNTTATNCCDPGGTFDATVQLPASASGTIYLEVLESSARDGSDLKVIRIPLTVR